MNDNCNHKWCLATLNVSKLKTFVHEKGDSVKKPSPSAVKKMYQCLRCGALKGKLNV